VVVSPTVIDLSTRAGGTAQADVYIENKGTIPATVTLSAVTFDGLTPVDPAQFSPSDQAQANNCVLAFDMLFGGKARLTPQGLDAHPTATVTAADGTTPKIPLTVSLATNRWCSGATLGGKIVLDIQPAP
jgi:hypothetical protein